MHNMLSFRKAFYILVIFFWLITMGLLMQRHYGFFGLVNKNIPNSPSSHYISEEQWMGVYLNNEKIGYQFRKISPSDNGYIINEAFRIKMIVMGKTKDIETSLNANLDKDLKLLSFSAKIKGDLELDLSGKVQDKKLSLSINSGGIQNTREIQLSKAPTLEGPAITGMLKGLKPGDRIRVSETRSVSLAQP